MGIGFIVWMMLLCLKFVWLFNFVLDVMVIIGGGGVFYLLICLFDNCLIINFVSMSIFWIIFVVLVMSRCC